MRKILFAASVAFLGFTSQAQEITADEIVNNYIENTGGAEAWSNLKGHKLVGEATIGQGMTVPVEMYTLSDGRMIMKVSFQGMEIVQSAFDGENSWSTNFMSMKPELADEETSENSRRAAGEYPSPFLNYEEKGYSIELLGEEIVEGVECYKIALTKKPQLVNGEELDNVEIYYFDKENFVPVQTEQEIKSGPAAGQVAISLFSDYQEVEGLYFPFSLTFKTKESEGQTVTFEEIVLNPEVDETIFEFPGTEE